MRAHKWLLCNKNMKHSRKKSICLLKNDSSHQLEDARPIFVLTKFDFSFYFCLLEIATIVAIISHDGAMLSWSLYYQFVTDYIYWTFLELSAASVNVVLSI